MKSFIRWLLGARNDSAQPNTNAKSRTIRRLAMIKEWSDLKDEERDRSDNWSIDVNSRLIDIRQRTQEIETMCVASHVLVGDKPTPEDALRMWKGRSLVHALNADLDDTALLAFSVMLVKKFNNHYPLVAQEFVERFDREIASMPDDQANSVRETASDLIWRFLAAFYEIGALRALGRPMNVFVSANVRHVFAGLLRENLLIKGYDDPGREWAQESLTNFVEGHMRNLESYFEGDESYLAMVFSRDFPDGMTAVSQTEVQFGAELDRIFASFVVSNRNLISDLLDGTAGSNL